jgi:predicted xylose isomerase-like sugar epimerase
MDLHSLKPVDSTNEDEGSHRDESRVLYDEVDQVANVANDDRLDEGGEKVK